MPRHHNLDSIGAAPDWGMPVLALIGYLVHHSPLYTVHFRMCAHGAHGGMWLGFTGHGATAKHAAAVTKEIRQEMHSFLRVNHWAAAARTPADLPPWRAGLRMTDTAPKLHQLLHPRSEIVSQSAPTNPLIFQFSITLVSPNRDVYFGAAKMRSMLGPGFFGRQHTDERAKAIYALLRRQFDRSTNLFVTVELFANRAPEPIRLRTLAHPFSGHVLVRPWGPEAKPMRAHFDVLAGVISLMAGEEGE